MNAVSPICLTDLAPALRWSRPADVADVLRHTRLVDGWWRSLPLPRVLDIAGPTWLAHCLARLTVEQWGHLAVCEFLPTLRALSVDMDEIAEPVRGAVLATAGNWDQLIAASPSTMRDWGFPGNCDVVEVVSMMMWRAVDPFTRDPGGGPSPSPALVIEAVRTVANWIPASAPEHVHNALAYLTTATGADCAGPTTDPEEAPQSPATRAIRTLRALRANRDQDLAQERPAPTTRSGRPAPTGPAPALARRGGSPLLGPGRTLRRPAFGPPKAMRGETPIPDVATASSPPLGEYPLIDLLDQLCRGWSDLERLIAAERLFASNPTSIRLLADQLQLDIVEIRNAQRAVEERLLQWLSSPTGAPMAKHLREVSEQLGTATTVDHLISAHPDHPMDVPSLGIPLWRIVMTLFTDRRLDDNWLLAADTGQLRWETRQLVVGQPSITEAGIRLGKLGIRAQALRAWLLSTPGVSIHDGYVQVDETVALGSPEGGGFGGHSALTPDSPGSTTANGLPIRRRPTAAPARPEPKPGVATSARCFRAPDGRWWHRVDVTADQLNGAPVTVPSGYATHLGLQPGRLLCLTGPGADLLVLVWRDQPAFDSLRPLLRRQGAQPGDRVFITVNGDRLDARLLPTAALGDNGPTGKALSLIGYTAPASTEEALDIIGRRISETGEPVGGPTELLELLGKRGDDDIVAELRPTLYATR